MSLRITRADIAALEVLRGRVANKAKGYWQPIQQGSPVYSTCLNCPPRPARLRFDRNPHPGFGGVELYRDGVLMEYQVHERGCVKAIREWDHRASEDPDAWWTIEVNGPLSGVRYTRVGSRKWLATDRNMGFA